MFVTDTHPLLRYLLNKHSRLSKSALRLFQQADACDAEILVPTPVVWEMTILCKRQKISPSVPFGIWLKQILDRPGFRLLPLEIEDFVLARDLTFTSDEFDVLIVANVKRLDARLITNDGVLHDVKPCKLFW